MSSFFYWCQQNQRFLAKIVPLLKAIMWELCWRLFSSTFSFCKIKAYYEWKHKFYRLCVRNSASVLLQIVHKLEKWQWRHNFPTWRHSHFWRSFVSLVKCSYLSKFHFNIITGSGFMTIFSFLQWAQNPEIRNTPVWFLPNIWRLRRVRVSDLARMSLKKSYWTLQNARVTVFTISELLRENQQGVKLPIPTQIKVKEKRDISVDMWSVASLCKRLA